MIRFKRERPSARKLNSNAGFTLIELMLAMSLFVSVMIISTVGFIAMNRTFARGVIQKELSESAQLITEEITRSIKENPVSAANGSSLSCISNCIIDGGNNYHALRFVHSCLYWNVTGGDGSVRRSYKSCANTNAADGEVLSDSRYKLEFISVNSVGGLNGAGNLYAVKGILRTRTEPRPVEDAFRGLVGTDDEKFTNAQCKGTTEADLVRSCAISKFQFIVNSRGAEI